MREIKVGKSRVLNLPFNTLRGSEFWFYAFLQFWKDEIDQINKIQSAENCKNSIFRTSALQQNWFHAKSEWRKNPEISSLCLTQYPLPNLGPVSTAQIGCNVHLPKWEGEIQMQESKGKNCVFNLCVAMSLVASATEILASWPTQANLFPSEEKLTECTQPPH